MPICPGSSLAVFEQGMGFVEEWDLLWICCVKLSTNCIFKAKLDASDSLNWASVGTGKHFWHLIGLLLWNAPSQFCYTALKIAVAYIQVNTWSHCRNGAFGELQVAFEPEGFLNLINLNCLMTNLSPQICTWDESLRGIDTYFSLTLYVAVEIEDGSKSWQLWTKCMFCGW